MLITDGKRRNMELKIIEMPFDKFIIYFIFQSFMDLSNFSFLSNSQLISWQKSALYIKGYTIGWWDKRGLR
jgi:hypothetical protein